jgi:chorismate dehydratase
MIGRPRCPLPNTPKPLSSVPLRVGRISYTNVAPIETAFDTGAVARNAIVTSGPPSLLNGLLSAGELDVSPVSAAHFLRNKDALELFGDCAIVARGQVISVLLVSKQPLARLAGTTIAVTGDSATARALLESVLRERYGVHATFEPVADPTAAALEGRPTLLIGDAAVAVHDLVPATTIHDLGSAWFDWTGLPMVYAVWAVRREVLQGQLAEVRRLAGAYTEARAWGDIHREAVIDAAMGDRPRDRAFYETYYTTLKYRLSADARRGLARFEVELAKLEAVYAAR